MWWKNLKPMLLFWLLGCLLSLFFIKGLQAGNTNPSLNEIKSSLLVTSQQLGKLNEKLLTELTASKKNLLLSQTELTQLQAQLQTAEGSLISLKASSDKYQKDVSAEISHLKWSRIEWTIGGLVVGVSAGLIIAALVR